jgi:hypothetical protein
VRAGRIIFIGVVIIAIVLTIVVLIPLPSVDRELNRYIPRGASEQNRLRGQTMSAVSFTTTQDVARVLSFYAGKFKMGPHQLSSRGGMTTMARGRIFGGFESDGIMPLSDHTGEAITIAHRESRKVVFVAVSRATNESLTHAMVLLERLEGKRSPWGLARNEALAWPPPDGKTGSSGMTLGVAIAEFSSGVPVENVVRHYSTNTGISRPQLLLEQKRQQGESALLEPTRSSRQSFYIFCFRSNASTQTQVSVSWVSK